MKKVLALVLALAMVMMMFVACKKQEQNSSADASKSGAQEPAKSYAMGYEKYNLACLYSEITGDFWSIVYNGCTAALEELKAGSGVTGYCVAPATATDLRSRWTSSTRPRTRVWMVLYSAPPMRTLLAPM